MVIFLLLNLIVIILPCSALPSHAISYGFSSGRFGDNILSFIHAYYVSYVTGIPLLYRSFDFSNKLNIHVDSLAYDKYFYQYRRTFHVGNLGTLAQFFQQIKNPDLPPTLFIIDYFPIRPCIPEEEIVQNVVIEIPWQKDPVFMEALRKRLSPNINIPNFTKDNGRLNVAVHVRTLSGLDQESSLIGYPLKHPFYDYQKRQIKKVYDYNLQRPLYVFIFSDTNKPLELLQEFKNSFINEDIEFDIQIVTNPDLNTTVEDFFAMQKFPVLIATQSHFSMLAAYLGTFDMYIIPMHVEGKYPYYCIDRVQMVSKHSAWFPYTLDVVLRD